MNDTEVGWGVARGRGRKEEWDAGTLGPRHASPAGPRPLSAPPAAQVSKTINQMVM